LNVTLAAQSSHGNGGVVLMRWFPLFATLILVAPVNAAQTRIFLIGGEPFAESDIIDARAQPDLDGAATILISFEADASKRIARITAAKVGKPMTIELDGKVLLEAVVREPIEGGSIQISGGMAVEDAKAMAKAISGKEPLPDSLEDE